MYLNKTKQSLAESFFFFFWRLLNERPDIVEIKATLMKKCCYLIDFDHLVGAKGRHFPKRFDDAPGYHIPTESLKDALCIIGRPMSQKTRPPANRFSRYFILDWRLYLPIPLYTQKKGTGHDVVSNI